MHQESKLLILILLFSFMEFVELNFQLKESKLNVLVMYLNSVFVTFVSGRVSGCIGYL